jgi:hypothetical protein
MKPPKIEIAQISFELITVLEVDDIPLNSNCYIEGLINSWNDHTHVRTCLCVYMYIYMIV